ncbi:hypothetical protein Tco_1553527 [Tanacetum coccineum]
MWVNSYSHFIKPVSCTSLWVTSDKATPLLLPQIEKDAGAGGRSASADPRSAATNDPRSVASDVHTFTGLLQSVEQQEKKAKQIKKNDAERVLKQAKKMGVYRKRGVDGWRGPSQRIYKNPDDYWKRIFKKRTKNKAKNNKTKRNGKDKVKSKPKSVKVRKSTLTKLKVNQVKKIQLEGLKIAKPQVVSQE